MTRYLLAANTVLPAEAKKMSPRREAKIRAQEEKAHAAKLQAAEEEMQEANGETTEVPAEAQEDTKQKETVVQEDAAAEAK